MRAKTVKTVRVLRFNECLEKKHGCGISGNFENKRHILRTLRDKNNTVTIQSSDLFSEERWITFKNYKYRNTEFVVFFNHTLMFFG